MSAKPKAAAKTAPPKAKQPSTPAPVGRPSDFTPELGARICELIATGKTLTEVCDKPGFPDRSTVWRWREAHEEFRDAFARAREEQTHCWADEIISISDDGSRDYTKNSDGRDVPDHDHIQRSKLRVDTRKFLMAKISPKLYGERVALEHSGKDGAPLTPVINVTIGPTEPSSSS